MDGVAIIVQGGKVMLAKGTGLGAGFIKGFAAALGEFAQGHAFALKLPRFEHMINRLQSVLSFHSRRAGFLPPPTHQYAMARTKKEGKHKHHRGGHHHQWASGDVGGEKGNERAYRAGHHAEQRGQAEQPVHAVGE